MAGKNGSTSRTKESLVDTRHRNDVARNRDGAFLIERHVDGVRSGDKEERVPVGRRTRDGLQRQIAAGARPVVDDDRLAQPLRHRLANEARNDIGCAASGDKNDQADGPRWVGLRRCHERETRERGSARGQTQEFATGSFIAVPRAGLETFRSGYPTNPYMR